MSAERETHTPLIEARLAPAAVRGDRAVEVLEGIGTPAARQLVERIATGEPGVRLTREAKTALGPADDPAVGDSDPEFVRTLRPRVVDTSHQPEDLRMCHQAWWRRKALQCRASHQPEDLRMCHLPRLGLALLATGSLLATGRADEAAVRKAVTFYASFDEAMTGDAGGGDLEPGTRFPHPTEKGRFVFEKGFDAAVLRAAKGKGVAGGAFEAADVRPRSGWLYFTAKGNPAYKKDGWSGSVSVWCNTDPDRLIRATFCDPVQITQRGYDDGVLWFDFNDAKPRDLRSGAYTARAAGRKAVPESDPKAPRVRAPGVGWKAGAWHHVALTFANLDTGRADAVTALYLDGRLVGEVKGQAIGMGWEVEKAGVYLSLGYVGLLDELALFDRALAAGDVALLHKTPDLLAPLRKK